MSVRLHDIAVRAQVSTATVSRVLNGRPGVSDEAREAVLVAIDDLGYERPARVRTAATSLIGLIVPELTNPFFTAFAQVVETALARHGFTPVLCTQTIDTVHEDDYVRTLLDRGVSGIIFASGIHAVGDTSPRRYQALRSGTGSGRGQGPWRSPEADAYWCDQAGVCHNPIMLVQAVFARSMASTIRRFATSASAQPLVRTHLPGSRSL